MDQSTLASEFVKTVPVIIGAALAILGGIIGQLIAHRLSQSRDRATLRRERVETLVKALYAHSQWLKDKQTTVLFREQEHDVASPFGDAQMLQKLYFPNLAQELVAIMQAELPLIKFISDQRLAQMKDKQAWIAAWNPEPYYDAYKVYLVTLEAAVAKCRHRLLEEVGG